MGGWIDGWIDGWIGWMGGLEGGWIGGWMDGWTERWNGGEAGEWIRSRWFSPRRRRRRSSPPRWTFLRPQCVYRKSPRCVRPIMAIHILQCSEASVPYIGDAFPTTQLRSCDGATALRRYGPFRAIPTDKREGDTRVVPGRGGLDAHVPKPGKTLKNAREKTKNKIIRRETAHFGCFQSLEHQQQQQNS